MREKEIIAEACRIIYNRLYSYEYKAGARMKPEQFTRERKMNFPNTMLMILQGTKKSLQASINIFIKEVKLSCETYSKQAFSQRRQNIKPEAFMELFEAITEGYYKRNDYKTYRGYRVSAVDGVCYNLPNTEELLKIYGGDKHNHVIPQVQAQGSCLMDILNGVLMDVQLSPYLANEREIAEIHLKRFEQLEKSKELILMDRGYPSRELIELINEKELHFLIRCPKNGFIKEIRNCASDDEIITYSYKKEAVRLRVVSVKLDNGNDETLITNIFNKDFTVSDFKYLYRLRWGIETRYNDIKNKLQIENFSGITPVAILQDFYATMLLSNMAAFAMIDAENKRKKSQINPDLKYEYKINVSMAISTLKTEFIDLFTVLSPRSRGRKLKKLIRTLLKNTVPIRRGRCFPRRRKHIALKFHNNLKNP